MIFELIVMMTPLDGSPGMKATKLYETRSECIAAGNDFDEKTKPTREEIKFEYLCEQRSDSYKGENGNQNSGVSSKPKPIVPQSSLELSCSGYSKLARSTVNYVFNIDISNNKFSGTKNSMSRISGNASVKDSLIVLTFSNGTTLEYTAWIDRNAGSIKIDISNDKLYLTDDTKGECTKFAGRAF